MKLLILLALAVALHAEDARPVCAGGNPPPDQTNCRPAKDAAPLATVEQLQAKVAEQKQEIERLKKQESTGAEQVNYLQRKLQMYQQGLFQCQDAQIDAQAKAKQEKPTK